MNQSQMPAPAAPLGARASRLLAVLASLVLAGAGGMWAGLAQAEPTALVAAAPAAAPAQQPPGVPASGDDLATLRVHGYTTVCNTCNIGQSNRQATAGSDVIVDANTGNVPEDPPYTDPEGPFSPLSTEAPDFDYVTWNPAWISERLGEQGLRDMWPGLQGLDEVSAASNIRIGGQNGSQKVWLRHWYEPTHLDKDLNADNCLTDDNNDGQPDAQVNPRPSNDDEWYPAIMTELTYLLMDNELPIANPDEDVLDDSAPRPACGRAGRTRIIFPTGVEEAATDAAGDLVGYGLTSLDADFDGDIDMVNVASEITLADDLGVNLDFDGDGVLDDLDGDRGAFGPLSCDELVVLHTDATRLGAGDMLQFLDHFVKIRTVADSSAVLEVWYTGDLQPRLVQTRSIGVGSAALAGDVGPLQLVNEGQGNVGVPIGAWFVHVQAVDVGDGTVTMTVGRALGAPCASMEDAPQSTNLSVGGPWFLKRFYVDGHEYNVVAVMSCDTDELQYITLRAPLPKVPVTIEQHSVRLQPYGTVEALHLPPPFNHEHTIVEDVAYLEELMDLVEPFDNILPTERPDILHYMGGPVGPIPPVLNDGDALTYVGRNPAEPVGPYDDWLASHWFYTEEDVNQSFVGQLREKFGAVATDVNGAPVAPDLPGSFFYNEQIFTLPWNYTEFVLPNQAEPAVDPDTGEQPWDADNYYLTSGFENPTARWRRWVMPDMEVPDVIPPLPPDLADDFTYYDEPDYGAPRRASTIFDPDDATKYFVDADGSRLFGGYPQDYDRDALDPLGRFQPCDSPLSRPDIQFGAGDTMATDPAGLPVEVPPYTDPFAPFNPQHPHAPRSDSLTFNPAYLDEFRNFGEDLRFLYQQIANNAQNARMKVYHRLWYQPDYTTKIRFVDDCDRDLSFPAMMQEFTYLFMDTTDNPIAVPPASSRIAFPMATRADQLPLPNSGGSLPAGGEFGYGVTSYDANFDGFDEASTIHTEESLNQFMDSQWQANRPRIQGVPLLPLPGPALDFDGDTITDTLDADCTALNGNEMVVLSVESLTLDLDENTPEGHAAMFLDHLVSLENVTPGSGMQVRFYFAGGNGFDARPERVGGIRTLQIGDAAIVDRFQDQVTIVSPGEANPGVDGAWFVFLEDVATDAERVTITIGRALGASHSAIDDGFGNHDLVPGDPWYLKRFYVDGHEYNVTALFTENGPQGCNQNFSFITIRTPVPKGNFFNPQDTLFQQGYFLDGLPDEMSVMPPFNYDHTIAVDVERIPHKEFAYSDGFDSCVGELAAREPLVERILEETREPRFGSELRETFNPAFDGSTAPPPDARLRDGWETHQTIVTPWDFTDVEVPNGDNYLLTLNWRTDVGRLSFYGCTRDEPGPFTPGPDRDAFGELVPNLPPLSHDDIADAADTWAPPGDVIPRPNQPNPPQTMPDDIVPYHDGACPAGLSQRVKVFYDPENTDDIYVNMRDVDLPIDFADLRLQKRANDSSPSAGDEILYTVTVTNDGPDDVADAIVIDELPAGVSYVGDTDGCVEGPPQRLVCSSGPLAVGNSRSFVIRALLDDDLLDGTTLVNVARATSPGSIDLDPTNNEDDATVVVNNMADLRITKAASDVTPLAGEQVVFLINVVNGGPALAENVVLEDVIPAGMTYIADNAGCDASGLPTLRCDLGDLVSGESANVAVTVEIDSGVTPGTALTNVATIDADTDDPDTGNNTGQSSVIVTAESDLRIEKTADDSTPPAGGQVTYTITVFNDGPSDVAGAEVVDSLPAGATYDSDTDSCVQAPVGVLSCTTGPIASGASASFDVVVTLDSDLPSGSQLDNVVVVSSPGVDDPNLSNNSDTVTVETNTSADLSVTKAAQSTVGAGDELIYTITVINNGPSDAEGVTVVDTLPTNVDYVSNTDGCVEGPSGTLTCNLGDLAAGAARSFTVTTDVDGGANPGSTLLNNVQVSSLTDDANAANDTDSASTQVASGPQADLELEKEAPATAPAGGTISYLISVENNGPNTAENVEVSDDLPAGVDYVGSTNGICSESPPASGELECDLGDIPPGNTVSFLVTVSIDGALSAGTILANTATASSTTSDPNTANNGDTASTTVFASAASADIEIEKSAPATVNAGEQLIYTISVTNSSFSTAATDVQVTDILPGGVTYVSDDAPNGCSIGVGPMGTRVCNLDTLAPSSNVTFSITVQVSGALPDQTSLMNMASVQATTADPTPDDNLDFVFTTVNNSSGGGDGQADLRITKTANTPVVVAGGALSYTIEVENLGPSAVAQVLVTDTLPSGLSYVSDTDSCIEIGLDTGLLICDLGAMVSGQTKSFVLETMVDAGVTSGTSLINVAVVGPGGSGNALDVDAARATAFASIQQDAVIDPNPGNNQSEASVLASRRADIAVRKNALNLTPGVGETFDWTTRVKNAGPSDAANVVLTDTLPAGVSYVSDSAGCGAVVLGNGCDIGSLPSGATRLVTITVQTDAGLANGTALTNQAVARSAEPDPDDSDNSDSASVVVNAPQVADLVMSKTASDLKPFAGQTVTFMLNVSNDGPSDAIGVVVADTLPAALDYVSDDASCDTSNLPTITCALGMIKSGESAAVALVTTVDAGATVGQEIVNGATASATTDDDDVDNNTDDVTLTIDDDSVVEADLAVTKVAGAAEPLAGSSLTYTVTVTNNGGYDANDVTLVDTLPDGVTYLGDDAGCDSGSLPTLTCDLGKVTDGASKSVVITVDLPASLADGAQLSNSATASADNPPDPNASDNTDAVTVTVRRQADLRINKSVTPNPVAAGQQVVFSLQIDNLGPSEAGLVTVVDELPSDVTYVADSGGCDTSDLPTISCDLGALVANGFDALQITADVNPGAAGTVANTASVTGDVPDGSPNNNSSTVLLQVIPASAADLSLKKSAKVPNPYAGDVVRFHLEVKNNGPADANGVVVTDMLPDGLSLVDSSVACSVDSGTGYLQCALDAPLLAGGTRTISIDARVGADQPEGTALVNRAEVGSDTIDTNSSNDVDDARIVVRAKKGGGAPDQVGCSAINGNEITLGWVDQSKYENEFVVEVSVGGGVFSELARVTSTTPEGSGEAYSYTASGLAFDTSYTFRVQAHNPNTGESSPYSDPSTCRTGPDDGGGTACYNGKLEMQGRSSHGGVLLKLDGVPVAVTDAQGKYEFCGVQPGDHVIETSAGCYFGARSSVMAVAGETEELAFTSLPGGDTNNDGVVDLFDLVRVGASYRTTPPADPLADCTDDGQVNLFDLVLVGSNYGKAGPVPFGNTGNDGLHRVDENLVGLPGVSGTTLATVRTLLGEDVVDWPAEPRSMAIDADGPPLLLRTRSLDQDTVAVDVIVHGVRGLYGTDLRMSFDPERVAVLDALDAPGVQVKPGEAWQLGGSAFFARNEVDREAGEIRFVVARLAPGAPLEGEVVLMTATFEARSGDLEGAWSLDRADLVDKTGRAIGVRIEGSMIYPEVDFGRLDERIYLPFAVTGDE